MNTDPLLDPTNDRFVLFPIKYPQFWDFYKKAMSCFWTVEELDFADDMKDWIKLNPDEKHFIKYVLAFFAASDGIVNENINMNFSNEITVPEIRAIYTFQSFMESIHCVSPSTMILTDKGYFKIKDLSIIPGTQRDSKDLVSSNINIAPIRVWNGKEFSEVIVKKTSDSARLYRVILSNGMELECTDEHKWIIGSKRVLTKNLKGSSDPLEADVITPFIYPIIDIPDPDYFPNPYTHAFFRGVDYTELTTSGNFNKDKYFVPFNYSVKTKLRWLEGLFDGNTTRESLVTINYEFVKNIQLLISTLGVHCSISKEENLYVLRLTRSQITQLKSLGFEPKRVLIPSDNEVYQGEDITVVSVTDTGRNSETYCFNEPKEHAGIFNGILTGQSETYSLLIDTYIKDEDEKKHLLKAIETIPIIKKKADWAMKWFSREAPFCNRLVAFAAVEGIFFSGSFCAIYWLKKRGLMLSGLCTSNEFISRDENMHTQTAVMIHKTLQPENQCSIEMITEIIKSAVAIEEEFVCDALPVSLIGMNSATMCQYIHFVADRLLEDLGAPKVWNEGCPFEWMQLLGLNGKTNFFEKRVSEYSRAGVGVDRDEQIFTLDADF